MKNLELLKEEYVEFINKFNEINSKILEAVDKDKEYKRYPSFVDNKAPDWIYTKYDYDDYCDTNIEVVEISDEEYKKSVEDAVKLRNELFEEKYKLKLEFRQWEVKNDVGYKDVRSFGDIEQIKMKWRGWDSSDYTFETMVHSINLTDEEEVNKLIANMQKVISMIKSEEPDEDDEYNIFECESAEYVDYLRIVNNETRHRMDKYYNTSMALEIMENHGIYNSYCESFKECVLNVVRLVDREFLFCARYMQSLK